MVQAISSQHLCSSVRQFLVYFIFILVFFISTDNSSPEVNEPVEHGLERSVSGSESAVSVTNMSSDCASAPRLLRSKSSNCFQRTSGAGPDSERRFFLPRIDRTGSVSAQRRPATSGEVRLNNERQDDTGGDVHRPPRSSAVTVWNSLTPLSPISNTSPTDQTAQSATGGSFVPTPPPHKNSTGNNN